MISNVSQSMMKMPGGPSGAILATAAEGGDIDAFGPAVDRMWAGIAGFLANNSSLVQLSHGYGP
jgi:hypothetical protein